MANAYLLLLAFAIGASAYTGPDLPPGPYCGITGECCRHRRDACAHRILNTLCYCDEFCDLNRSHDDCCPDYLPVCRNQTAPGTIIEPCKHRGEYFLPGQTRIEDCNTCECIQDPVNERTSWSCQKDECLMSDEVLYGVNQAGLSWRAYKYPEFYGKKLKDGLIYKLGTLPLSQQTLNLGAADFDKEMNYPVEFDARTHWPRGFISPVVDQGWCGTDWAVSIATIASDRFAIQSNGTENVVLSPQTMLSCNERRQQGCKGGYIDIAWNFAGNHGLVEEKCFPYKATKTHCPYAPKGDLIQDRCPPPDPRRTSRYKVGPPYRMNKEKDIMYDLMDSGPVQAIMTVHQDFFHYRDGIYRRSQHGDNKMKGFHSVRIVGWGEDHGDKFWIVANSWGTQWGENGYFRIARGSNESGIETFVVAALSDVPFALMRT